MFRGHFFGCSTYAWHIILNFHTDLFLLLITIKCFLIKLGAAIGNAGNKPLTSTARISALELVGDLLRKVGVSSCL